jgi:hypothetical protein
MKSVMEENTTGTALRGEMASPGPWFDDLHLPDGTRTCPDIGCNAGSSALSGRSAGRRCWESTSTKNISRNLDGRRGVSCYLSW